MAMGSLQTQPGNNIAEQSVASLNQSVASPKQPVASLKQPVTLGKQLLGFNTSNPAAACVNDPVIPVAFRLLDTCLAVSITEGYEKQSFRMNEEGGYLGQMTYQCLYSGIMDKLRSSRRDDDRAQAAIHRLRTALKASEASSPSFLFDLTKLLLSETQLSVNLQESYLRLQDSAPTDDLAIIGQEHMPEYQELSRRAVELRRVLARVPEEMTDRHAFLETIKVIASSIKKLLDAINAVIQVIPVAGQQAVDKRKREFVRYAKGFSNTLKTYFRDQNANQVTVSANQLVFQTSLIVKTINDKLRRK